MNQNKKLMLDKTHLLRREFDACIMLTWSSLKTEPISNRFNFTKLFSKLMPVVFCEHSSGPSSPVFEVENFSLPNVTILRFNTVFNISSKKKSEDLAIHELKVFLKRNNISKPLFWIYDSLNYQFILDAFPHNFRIYHATENYLVEQYFWGPKQKIIQKSVLSLIENVDLIFAVSKGVLEEFEKYEQYRGNGFVFENGVDAEFYFNAIENCRIQKKEISENTVIYQGGINDRIDYPLLAALIERMDDWKFVFVSNSAENPEFLKLLKAKNVSFIPNPDISLLPAILNRATVGIIPYKNNKLSTTSTPLKAWEYVACGLPVVTLPIDSLANYQNIFTFADNIDAFEQEIRKVAHTRKKISTLKNRRKLAEEKSYARSFNRMTDVILDKVSAKKNEKKRLKICILYDSEGSLHVGTIKEHLQSFEKYSSNEIYYLPATNNFWVKTYYNPEIDCDLNIFDVVVVHYSVRVAFPGHLDSGMLQALKKFNGYKVLYVQDEYEGTVNSRSFIKDIGINLVYTCVPIESIDFVYPKEEFQNTEFIQTLTGFVPETPEIDRFCQPLAERHISIAYRGRELSPIYGKLAFEKFEIGLNVKKYAEDRGINCDIEVAEEKRIYGSSWFEFIGSARATLGTESGSNIFDFDGSIAKKIEELKNAQKNIGFLEIWEKILKPHENQINMGQISPKLFEAIRLKTALILFEGAYSGVLEAGLHYIPLKKDFSNIDDVFQILNDDVHITEMTSRAFKDIILTGHYSYQSFVHNFDDDINQRLFRQSPQELLISSIIAVNPDGSYKQAMPFLPLGLYDGSSNSMPNFQKIQSSNNVYPVEKISQNSLQDFKYYNLLLLISKIIPKPIRRKIALPVLLYILNNSRIYYFKFQFRVNKILGLFYMIFRYLWHKTPKSLRKMLIPCINLIVHRVQKNNFLEK